LPSRRILLVSPRLNLGGVESYVTTLARQLRARGHYVVIASGGGTLAKLLAAEGFPHYWAPIRLGSRAAGLLLERAVRREGIELVHAHAIDAGLVAAPVCERLRVPWVMHAHSVVGGEYSRPFASCAKLICVCEAVRRRELELMQIDPDQLCVVNNSVDTRIFSPDLPDAGVRASLGLAPEHFVIGLASRITSVNSKGHHDLLKILAGRPQACDWRLLFVGTGRAFHRVRSLARQLGVADRVVFTGRRLDMPSVYQAMDVLALPSYWETLPLAILEAMAMGKPAVGYLVGGVNELILEGVTGYALPKGDVEALGERLDHLALHPEVRQAMGQHGRAHVENHFRIERLVDEVEAIYEEALDRPDSLCIAA